MTPTANTIAIRFVFASDEYPEFVESSYNDVIAIFVNGVNCANYNGRPVSVNSINADVNANLFIDNDTGTRNTEMDGLTVPLDCVASVTPNAPNHVTIVIADTADQIYDSAVFLASGGIRSPGSGPVTNSNVIRAIEYYHAGFNHYFVTTIPNEITLLDNGTFVGWARTGKAFNVFVLGTRRNARRLPLLQQRPRQHPHQHPLLYVERPRSRGPEGQSEMGVRGHRVRRCMPPVALCPAGTQALYRAYNNEHGRRAQPPFPDRRERAGIT